MLTKKDTYTLHELLIDANEKTQSYVHIMKQGNDGSAEIDTNPIDIEDQDVENIKKVYEDMNITVYKTAQREKDIVEQKLIDLPKSSKYLDYEIFVQDVIAYFNKWFRANEIDPPTNTDTESVTPYEMTDTNNALWSIADDMRQRKQDGEFDTFMDAYRWAEKYMTQKGRSIKAKRIESAYHKAKSEGKVD